MKERDRERGRERERERERERGREGGIHRAREKTLGLVASRWPGTVGMPSLVRQVVFVLIGCQDLFQ